MKKKIKVIVLILSLFMFVGCGMNNNASESVREYLDNYKNLDDSLSEKIDNLIESENLTVSQEKTYREILERQYEDLTYEIVEEEYNGDEAEVEVEITVYDYFKAQKEVTNYLNEHRDEFYDEGEYNESLYTDYKLEVLKNYKETVTYTIEFKLNKESGKWVIKEISDEDIEKIHGVYNYTVD